MSTATVTHNTETIDFLSGCYPAFGNFKAKRGHGVFAECYTLITAIPSVDNVIDTITTDALVLARSLTVFPPSQGQMIPFVLPLISLSTASPSLDWSYAAISSSLSTVEIQFDYQTTTPSVMKLAYVYPTGSLQEPI